MFISCQIDTSFQSSSSLFIIPTVSPLLGPDVTVNTHFMDDPHYVDAIRKNLYNRHFEGSVNLMSSESHLKEKTLDDLKVGCDYKQLTK